MDYDVAIENLTGEVACLGFRITDLERRVEFSDSLGFSTREARNEIARLTAHRAAAQRELAYVKQQAALRLIGLAGR